MFIKQAIIKAYNKSFGFKEVDKEVLAQSDPLSLKAINIVFGAFEEFIEALRAEAPAPVAKKVTK